MNHHFSIHKMISKVAEAYMIPVERIYKSDHTQEVSDARSIAMWIARRNGLSYHTIAEIFHRDHSTVISNVKKIEALMKWHYMFRDKVAHILLKADIDQNDWIAKPDTSHKRMAMYMDYLETRLPAAVYALRYGYTRKHTEIILNRLKETVHLVQC